MGVVDLFRVVVFGLGFAAGIFFMSCPSCCGHAEVLIVSTSVNTKAARHSLRQLINEFMYPPEARLSAKQKFLIETQCIQAFACAPSLTDWTEGTKSGRC